MEQTTDFKGAWTPNNIAKVIIESISEFAPDDTNMDDPENYGALLLALSKISAGVVSQLPLTRKGRDLMLEATIGILRKCYAEMADKIDAERKLN